jgi:hypothetical protein
MARGNKIAGSIHQAGVPSPADMQAVIEAGRKVALRCEGVVFDAEYATFQVKGRHGSLVGLEAVIALPLETMLQACGVVMMQTLPGLVAEKRKGDTFRSDVHTQTHPQTQTQTQVDGAEEPPPEGKAG